LSRIDLGCSLKHGAFELLRIPSPYIHISDTDESLIFFVLRLLDRLRELGRLPEVVNYPEWKSKVLACYEEATSQEDWWHLPDGRMLHVMTEKRSDGGVTYLFIDETERLALEREYNALIDVQRETLDSLKEGVAVFATDGRLKLFNSAFAEIWSLSRRVLAESPHIDEFIDDVEDLSPD